MTENGRKCIMNFNDLAHGCTHTHTHARAGDKGFVRSELLKKFFLPLRSCSHAYASRVQVSQKTAHTKNHHIRAQIEANFI